MNKEYSLEPSLRWARGGHFTPDKIAEIKKEAEEKGFQRGKAKGKVITGVISKGGQPKSKGTHKATPSEVNEAFDMFPDAVDEKEAVSLYLEVKKDREKNRKKE